jgi:hypothetical protein
MAHKRCALCGKGGKTHRKANAGVAKKGRSALKVAKPRAERIRRWDV